MQTQAYLLHALSALHAGAGRSVDVIDLPIARQRATQIPIVPGSSVKGVLRDARKPADGSPDLNRWLAVFGPLDDDAAAHAGALIVGDARLLMMPVRSFVGTFAWATSPLLLRLAARDFKDGGLNPPPRIPAPSLQGAVPARESCLVHRLGNQQRIFLEDLDLNVATVEPHGAAAEAWAEFLSGLVGGDEPEHVALFRSRFVVVHDETMSFLWENATQIDMRVRLDPATRTVAKGALWSEESLAAESLLVGLLAADRSRRAEVADMAPRDVLAFLRNDTLQFGGKATVGRGRCRFLTLAATTVEGAL